MPPWIHFIYLLLLDLYSTWSPKCRTSLVKGPFACLTEVWPHPVSIRASTSFPFRDKGMVKHPQGASQGVPTFTSLRDFTEVQSILGHFLSKRPDCPQLKQQPAEPRGCSVLRKGAPPPPQVCLFGSPPYLGDLFPSGLQVSCRNISSSLPELLDVLGFSLNVSPLPQTYTPP